MTAERCPSCDSDASGANRMGVNIPGAYDGVLFWRCMFCGHDWHRFSSELMRSRAEPYMNLPSDPH